MSELRPPAPRLLDPFRVLAPAERSRHLAAYERHLEQRDGALDLPARRLSRREAYLEDLARKPVLWRGDFDVESFNAHFGGGKGPAPDVRTAWLVTAAEANEDEKLRRGARAAGASRSAIRTARAPRSPTCTSCSRSTTTRGSSRCCVALAVSMSSYGRRV